jgi:hypothetical protein
MNEWILFLAALALLAGCQTMPEGPTVTSLQGDTRTSDEFRTDDGVCRQYAHAQAEGGTSASGSIVAGSTVGSLIGGIDSAQYAGYGLQQPYNRAYVRCMYLKGNKVYLLARERWPAPRSPWPPDSDAFFLPFQR